MNNTFTFDDLPEAISVEPGGHTLKILSLEEVTAQSGTLMYQFTHEVVGTEVKINYDNCALVKSDGTKVALGAKKLKNILKAVGVTPQSFTAKTLLPLVKGKMFKAKIQKNDRGYWTLNDIDSIKPMPSVDEVAAKAGLVEFSTEEVIIDTTTEMF